MHTYVISLISRPLDATSVAIRTGTRPAMENRCHLVQLVVKNRPDYLFSRVLSGQ